MSSTLPKVVPRGPLPKTLPLTGTPDAQEHVQVDDRGLWMAREMEEDEDALELRERTYHWTGMHSFGILTWPNATTCKAHLDRHRVLELIYQHMHSIGMDHAASTLSHESKLEFQRKDQNMDRTDLRLLLSLAMGPRENIWDTSGLDSVWLVEEPVDEDNASVNYKEPLGDYKKPLTGVRFAESREFRNITLAPLKSLVTLLVMGDVFDIVPRPEDRQKFFLTLNSICKSEHLFEHLFTMFNEVESVEMKKAVLAFIDEWVRFSGLFIGQRTLRSIILFLQTYQTTETAALLQLIPKLQYGNPVELTQKPPAPVISNAVKLLDPELRLTTPEPEEVARQLTMATHKLFSAIHPREFYAAISTRRLSLKTPGLNELYDFGERLKLLIASTILIYKNDSVRSLTQIIDTMEQLLILRNYESLSWYISALEMKCVQNLSATYSALSDSSKEKWNRIRAYSWKNKNEVYERSVAQCTDQPTIPNMRYELSITTVDGYKGDEFVHGLVNWEKRQRAATYILHYSAFQNRRYNFHLISQIQSIFKRPLEHTKEQLNAISMNREAHTPVPV